MYFFYVIYYLLIKGIKFGTIVDRYIDMIFILIITENFIIIVGINARIC